MAVRAFSSCPAITQSPVSPPQADANERGIKRTGLIYAPRRSWWLGIFFIGLSVGIFVITIATAVYHP